MTWGYNDDTCPPTTSYIVYNVLNCPKEALITPINEHWTSEATEYGHFEVDIETHEISKNILCTFLSDIFLGVIYQRGFINLSVVE